MEMYSKSTSPPATSNVYESQKCPFFSDTFLNRQFFLKLSSRRKPVVEMFVTIQGRFHEPDISQPGNYRPPSLPVCSRRQLPLAPLIAPYKVSVALCFSESPSRPSPTLLLAPQNILNARALCMRAVKTIPIRLRSLDL